MFLDSDEELYDDDTLAELVKEISRAPSQIGSVAFSVVDGFGNKKCFVSKSRLVLSYSDIVCEKEIHGEFINIYRLEALQVRPWPPYPGLESLKHWGILKYYDILVVDRPGRIYHMDGNDNLTGAIGTIARSKLLAEAMSLFISEHRSEWLKRCPCRYGHYLFYYAMYQTLSGENIDSFKSLIMAFSNGASKKKCLLLFFSLFLPAKFKKLLFTYKHIFGK